HILRDPRSLAAALGMPVMFLALFGYALSMDVDHIPTAIVDQDHSAASQDLIQAFRGSRYFTVTEADSYAAVERRIVRDEILLGVIIPQDYARNTKAGHEAKIQFLLDGSDSNTASLAQGYAEGLLRLHADVLAGRQANTQGRAIAGAPIEPRVRIWYNNDL